MIFLVYQIQSFSILLPFCTPLTPIVPRMVTCYPLAVFKGRDKGYAPKPETWLQPVKIAAPSSEPGAPPAVSSESPNSKSSRKRARSSYVLFNTCPLGTGLLLRLAARLCVHRSMSICVPPTQPSPPTWCLWRTREAQRALLDPSRAHHQGFEKAPSWTSEGHEGPQII